MSSSFVGGDKVVVRAYDDEVDALVLAAEAAAVALVIENGDDAMDDDDDRRTRQPTKYTRDQRGIDRRGCATSRKCRGGWYLIVLGAVELGRGRELIK